MVNKTQYGSGPEEHRNSQTLENHPKLWTGANVGYFVLKKARDLPTSESRVPAQTLDDSKNGDNQAAEVGLPRWA